MLGATSTGAQNPSASELLVELEERDRWLAARQRPAFTPYRHARAWFAVDSIRLGDDGERQLHLRVAKTPFERDRQTVLLSLGRDGRVSHASDLLDSATVQLNAVGPHLIQTAHGPTNLMVVARADRLLPRLWELVPTFRAADFRPGARWIDTLDIAAGGNDDRRAVGGVRVSTLLGDTIVRGRRLQLVRDSAWVRLVERQREREGTLDTTVVVERMAQGVLLGRHLYDPARGLFLVRHDTAALEGEAVLHYPDGRTFRTPVRYERTRRWSLHDARTGAAPRAALSGAEAGAARLRSSPSADPPGRSALGDTALLHAQLSQRRVNRARIDTTEMRAMLAFMEDPGLAFAFGVDREWFYLSLRDALTDRPPVLTADTARWPCTPDACRLLAEQWYKAAEPRLRTLALMAAVVLEPERWADTLLAHASSPFIEPAVRLVRGMGSAPPGSRSPPLPPPEADWRTWRDWGWGIRRDGAGDEPQRRATMSTVGATAAGESHAQAIRFYEAMTRRDVVGELRAANATAASDSAWFVTGRILHALGELHLSDDQIVQLMRTGPHVRAELAELELRARFRDSTGGTGGPDADAATALEIHDRLIAHIVDGAPIWPALTGAVNAPRVQPPLHVPHAGRAVLLLADNVHPALRERWKDRVTITTATEWRQRTSHEAAVAYWLPVVRRSGRFVAAAGSASEYGAQRTDSERVPSNLHARRWLLAEVDGEWVVLATGY